MTLRVTVEILPGGDPARAQTLGVVEIDNSGRRQPHGPADLFRYDVLCTPGEADDRRRDRAHYVGFLWHCRSRGWWQLVAQAFALRERQRT